MKKPNRFIIISFLSIAVVAVGVLAAFMLSDKDSALSTDNNKPVAAQKSTSKSNVATTPAKTTEELLVYLIEEEKLAHDVYTVMYQKYGANVFGNILESESTHQSQVLALLVARNIVDPRSSDVGVFKNAELQAFYNKLVEQGNVNAVEAYKAGVAIEEKDIADISTQLATATDQDVIAALEILRSGSENHLRAFNRQL